MDLFRDLLNLICERFPAEDSSQDGTYVRVSCSSHEANAVSVSPYGFLLLEAAEGLMGSTEQNLELVVVDNLSDHLLSAVSSRMARQQGIDVDTKVVVRKNIQCQGVESASAISSLMQNCRRMELRGNLQVPKDIRGEGWAALREALSWKLHDIPHLDTGRKSYMASASREDLRAIWECLSLSWKFMEDHEAFAKQRGEEGWSALEQFLDLTNDEWRTAKRAMGGQQAQVMFVNGHQFDFPGLDLDNMGGADGLQLWLQQEGIVLALLAPGMPPQVVGANPAMVQFAPVVQLEEVQGQVGEVHDQVEEGQALEVEGQGLEVEEQALEAEG